MSSVSSEIYTNLHQFNDPDLVDDIGKMLNSHGIDYIVNDISGISGRSAAFLLQLKVKYTVLEEAEKVLSTYYGDNILEAGAGSPLLHVNNYHLKEIVRHPGRNTLFDYQLSREILRSRGEEVPLREIRQIQKKHFEEKLAGQDAPDFLIVVGYIFSILGGVIGAIIGWTLFNSRTPSINGERLHSYPPTDRQHGVVMMVISGFIIFLAMLVKFNKS